MLHVFVRWHGFQQYNTTKTENYYHRTIKLAQKRRKEEKKSKKQSKLEDKQGKKSPPPHALLQKRTYSSSNPCESQTTDLRAEHGFHPSQLGKPISPTRLGVQHIRHAGVYAAVVQLVNVEPDGTIERHAP